jgi:Bacterial antitoxin of type II TA system, VapB
MPNDVAIDPKLLQEALSVSGEQEAGVVVTRALEEFIARRSQAGILELFGKLEWDPDYDYKAARGARDRKLERHFSGEDPD